jgi:hypothetical protein
MPVRLSTTVSKVSSMSNSTNSVLIREFYEFMKNNGASEKHMNNNRKVIMNFANYIGDVLLSLIFKEKFVDTKIKSS